MNKIEYALKLAKECTYADEMTEGAKEHLRNVIDEALNQALHLHSVMQGPQFEELLQVRLDELPYTKHLDDGQYNDGQVAGFEYGARWLYEKLSSGTAVGNSAVGKGVSVECVCGSNDVVTRYQIRQCANCGRPI